MILDANNPEHANYSVYDSFGQKLGFVQRYDTVTKETSMFIKVSDELHHQILLRRIKRNYEPVLVTFILDGSYAKDPSGKIITENYIKPEPIDFKSLLASENRKFQLISNESF